MDLIENLLKQLKEAAEQGNYQLAEERYHQALARGEMVFGNKDASLALMLICLAGYYENQGKPQKAECFNKRVRELLKEQSLRLRE